MGLKSENVLGYLRSYIDKTLEGAGALKGEKGDRGAQGPVGPQGEQGIQGPKGDTGKSAYDIAVENGFKGSEADWYSYTTGSDIGLLANSTTIKSYAGLLKINEIGGVMEQDSTSGKNLVNDSQKYNYYNNIFIGTTSYQRAYLPLEKGTYSVTCVSKSDSAKVIVESDTSKIAEGNIGTTSVASFTLESSKYVEIYITGGLTSIDDVVSVQLELGESTDYEPYTNGASPNPSYPQEIRNVRGKNLFDCRGLTEKVDSGVTFTPIYDENGNLLYINVNDTATAWTYIDIPSNSFESGTYIMNGYCSTSAITGISMQCFKNDTRNHLGNDTGSGFEFTLEESANIFIRIAITSGTVCNNLKFYPMIRHAYVKDSTYVPYGLLRIKTYGKNLFNGVDQHYYLNTACTHGSMTDTDVGFVLKVDGGKYTVSTKVEQARFRVACANKLVEIFGTPFECFRGQNKDGTSDSVTIDCSGYSYLIVNATDLSAIQVEEGEEATEYEPYTESVITFSQPIELYGLDDVRDILTSKQIKRKFGVKVLNGSEDWNCKWQVENLYVFSMPPYSDFIYRGSSAVNYLCSHFRAIRVNDRYQDNTVFANSGKYFTFTSSSITTLEEWKAHLASNPITVVYELAEETTEELPLADQIALNSVPTYEGITHVEVVSDIKPELKGEYGATKMGAYTLESLLTTRNMVLSNSQG